MSIKDMVFIFGVLILGFLVGGGTAVLSIGTLNVNINL